MPPRASHRVDLLLLPGDIEREPDPAAFQALVDRWTAAGQMASLVEGGFRRLWLDVPGHVVLYTNQQGGMRVQCPVTGAPVAREFGQAVEVWRAGGARALACPACLTRHALEALVLLPPGGFARGAVIFTDVGEARLAAGVQAQLAAVLGEGSRTVVRRVG